MTERADVSIGRGRREDARPSRGASAPPPARAAALLALQRAAGNRATSALVQRQILDGRNRPKSWDDLTTTGTISNAPKALYYVMRFWAQSPSHPSPPYVMGTAKALLEEARAKAADMPAEFADSLRDRDELDEFLASMSRLKRKPSQTLADALDRRRRSFGHQFVTGLPTGYTLPTPNLDPRYSTPSGWSSQPGGVTGRDDASWHSVQNPTGVGGQTTGSVNVRLVEEARQQGGLVPIGTSHQQICPTCGRPSDAVMFEVDHQQAFSDIRDNLHMLAAAMTHDGALYKHITSACSQGLFVVSGTPGQPGAKVEPSRAAMNVFSNDLDNLMRICRLCNGPWGKSDMEILKWYAQSPYFGPRFLQEHMGTGTVSVIARTKSGEGWGKVARAWFAEHHLPILKDQFALARIGHWLHGQLTTQSQSQLESRYETDPVKQSSLRQQAETIGGTSRAFLGGMEVDQEYFSGQLLGKQPTPMRPGSPAMWTHQHVEQARRREERIEQERVEGSDAYRAGFTAGAAMMLSDERPYGSDQGALGAYRKGYADGERAAQEAQAAGRRQGWEIDLTGNLQQLADAIKDLARRAGFVDAVGRRVQAWTTGFAQGRKGGAVDLSQIPTGGEGSERLVRDCVDGWRAGLAEFQQVRTSVQ